MSVHGNAVKDVGGVVVLAGGEKALAVYAAFHYAGFRVYDNYIVFCVYVGPYFPVYPLQFVQVVYGAFVHGYLNAALHMKVFVKEEER